MTLIIGAKCHGGLVLAADRKILRGGETDYRNKIFELGGIVLAFEGLTGLQDDFLLVLQSELDTARGFSSLYQAKLLIEDIVADFSGRYVERLGDQAYFGALVGGLSGIFQGPAELYYVHPQGYGEAVSYRCSGHGADYAHSLAKYLLTSEVSIEDSAYRAAFVISWVGEDIDSTVGGTPQVAIIRDENAQVDYLDEERVAHAMSHADQTKSVLPDLFKLDE